MWLAALAAGTGCTPLPSSSFESWRPRATVRDAVRGGPAEAVGGHSVRGEPLVATVHGSGSRTVLLLGAIHGNEPGSHTLVDEFRRWAETREDVLDGLRLVVATPLNPDGLARGTRANVRGVDLNRNFPARNFAPSPARGPAPLSEPEARFVRDLLAHYEPSLVISVHQPRHSVNYDGPAAAIAEAMAQRNGYRVEATVGYTTPGSLGSWVGVDLGVPIITLELPRRPRDGSTFLADNLDALLVALSMAPDQPSEAAQAAWRAAPQVEAPAPSANL